MRWRRARWTLRIVLASGAVVLGVLATLHHAPLDVPWRTLPDVPTQNVLAPSCPLPTGERPSYTVAELNRIVTELDLPGWQAGDIGASGLLPDGRVVWAFGDTVRDASLTPRLVANSLLVASRTCVSQVVTPTAGPIVPDAGGVVMWPMSLAVLPEEDGVTRFVVSCSRIRRGAGAWGFTDEGTRAAVFRVTRGGAPQLEHTLDLAPDDPDPHAVTWGAALAVESGWLYVYGTRLPEASFGRELHVARTPVADPAQRSRWQAWDGHRWQGDLERSAVVLPAAGGVSQTLSVSVVGGAFVAVSKRDGDLGDFVYTWRAAGPTGPWRPAKGTRAPFEGPDSTYRYAPLAHPEVPLADGSLLVSVSRNTSDLTRLLADPSIGRPYFVQVARP